MQELRAKRDAPVDSMGAEVLAEEGEHFEFQTLVALMLSSQTKDQVVAETMQRLKSQPAGLSVAAVRAMAPEALNELIARVGFHNNKTKFIKEAVELLHAQHQGRVPDTLEGLLALPGVGPKMAFLVLNIAFGKTELGIGVDTHMHRMCNQLGWTRSKTPEETRRQLESWLPRPEWPHINLTMVGVGQMLQQPRHRDLLVAHVRSWPDRARVAQATALLRRLGLPSAALAAIQAPP